MRPSFKWIATEIGSRTKPTSRSANARLTTKKLKGVRSSRFGSLYTARQTRRFPADVRRKSTNETEAVKKDKYAGAKTPVQFRAPNIMAVAAGKAAGFCFCLNNIVLSCRVCCINFVLLDQVSRRFSWSFSVRKLVSKEQTRVKVGVECGVLWPLETSSGARDSWQEEPSRSKCFLVTSLWFFSLTFGLEKADNGVSRSLPKLRGAKFDDKIWNAERFCACSLRTLPIKRKHSILCFLWDLCREPMSSWGYRDPVQVTSCTNQNHRRGCTFNIYLRIRETFV